MTLLSITDAAKFVDKSVQTLNRHVKAGKISKDSAGKFNTEELIRVYNLKQLDSPQPEAPSPAKEKDMGSLQQRLDELENTFVSLQKRLEQSEKMVISLQQQLEIAVAKENSLSQPVTTSNEIMIIFKADEKEYRAFANQ